MKNLLKEVVGNIYGMGIYCFKCNDEVLYVGGGMINDRLQSHLFGMKRGKYEGTNKDILQRKYNIGELSFEVLHFSENNSTYINGTDKERKVIQQALEVLEQFYVNLYADSICNQVRKITKSSSSPNKLTTYKRRQANTGSKNPNVKYSEELISNILWMKLKGYKPRHIVKILEAQGIDINKSYISNVGITKWIYLEPIKPDFIESEVI